MRKYLYLAMAAASAAILAAPVAADASTATSHGVLTIGKVGGTAVKTKAVLKASLARGTSAVFSTGGDGNLVCKSSSFSAKVTKNPKAKGTATESLTISFSNCKFSLGSKVVLKVRHLPYMVSVSGSGDHPVSVTGTKKSESVSIVVPSSCAYKINTLKGSASNKGSTITFTKQNFTYRGPSATCPSVLSLSAKYGPVEDSSVKHNPRVFLN